jgi:hypothetical protein
MTYSEDSLKVSENDDGTLAIEWDPNDPKYAIFNTMTEDEMQAYITRALEEFIAQYESDNSGS